jgi:tetratricopeptide (TPR) repeat protein
MDPNNSDSYINRGTVNVNRGRYNQAIFDFNKAIEINSMFALAYYHRGKSYYSKREYDKSLNDITRLKELGYRISSEFFDQLCPFR